MICRRSGRDALRSALLLLLLLGAWRPGAAGAASVIAPAAATAAAAPATMRAAQAEIDGSEAGIAALSREIGQAHGPIETAELIDRADAASRRAQHGVAALAATLSDPRLSDTQRAAAIDRIARGGRVIGAAAALAARIDASSARRFERTIAMRAASPLDPAFWRAVAAALPRDLARLNRFLDAQADATWRGASIGGAVPALLGLGAATLLLLPVRLGLRRRARSFMIDRVPQSRLRRSGWALWSALSGAAIPWLALLAIYEGFRAGGMVSAAWQPLAAGALRGVAVAAAVWAVAGALLQRNQPSWRLLPVGEATASELQPLTTAAAAVVLATVVADEALAAAGIGSALRDAAGFVETLLHTAVSVLLLLAIAVARRRADADADRADAANEEEGAETVRRELVAVAIGSSLCWLVVAATLVALLAGYVALALLLSRMLVWLPLVGATLSLSWLVADDLTAEAVNGGSALGRSMHHAFGVRASLIDQAGVALSAILRLVLLIVAVIVAFAPFGSNLDQLAGLSHAVRNGITVGQFTIAPGAILRGLIVLAAGLFVVRVAERWLAESYLPKTELDEGARNSILTVARYIGFILATLWALAALGIGFERIALLLSALSVGIGFGLQAITQNFVSGLILLIERPVKIGDLIEVGGQKGDVRRIRVRATEIEVADRSTLIVPNSELITKTVRNMTHANPMGVVQLKFTVPLDTDVDQVRHLVLTLFKEAKAVFDVPEPKVFIDSIDEGAVHFNATGYCHSPRAAYATRSDVLFRLIMELRARGIAIGSSTVAAAAAGGGGAPPGSSGTIDDG